MILLKLLLGGTLTLIGVASLVDAAKDLKQINHKQKPKAVKKKAVRKIPKKKADVVPEQIQPTEEPTKEPTEQPITEPPVKEATATDLNASNDVTD